MSEKKVFGSRVDKEVVESFQERLKQEDGRSIHSQGAVVEELIRLYGDYGDTLFSIIEDYTHTEIVNNQCDWSFSRNWGRKLAEDFEKLNENNPGNSIPLEPHERDLKEAIPYKDLRTLKNHIEKMKFHDFITDSRETENGIFYHLDVDRIEDFLEWRENHE